MHVIARVVALTVFLSACSATSVLIHDNDTTFSEGQERLERTNKIVDELKVPVRESTLFLQAESFYRYRFEPQPRGAAMYLAEAAAALTDFPAFQSLAGSLDLQDLRYRSPDSAVQLWESLLTHYPQTSLKPLTLYRLGWAYRNTGARGLPRESPDEAFDELIKERPGSPFALLAQDAKNVSWKSKDTAATRSLLPGLGQIYVGETGSGVIRIGVAVVSLSAFVVPLIIASQRGGELSWKHDWPLLVTGLTGLVVLSFDYTNSYEDAMRGVVQWNERTESEFNQTHPTAP